MSIFDIFASIHFENKTKSGIPFQSSIIFPASFNNVCPKKWFTALLG